MQNVTSAYPLLEGTQAYTRTRMIGNFLVSPSMGAYLHHFEDGATICVAVPSMAEHYNYRTADRVAYFLRSNGFEEAHVTDLAGMPATPQSIANAQVSEYTVVFNKIYHFAGFDRIGQPQGTTHPSRRVYVSKDAAKEVWLKLKKMFEDAEIVERPLSELNVEDELKALQGIAPSPESLRFKDDL